MDPRWLRDMTVTNPKSEIRNPKEIRNSKSETKTLSANGGGAALADTLTSVLRSNSLWMLAVSVAVTGCANKERQRAEMFKAFAAGEEHARQEQQAKQPKVSFRGPVKNPMVPWSEGLMLTKALAAAEYTGLASPRNIMLMRQGQVYQINPRRLATGQDDVELQAGDVIELVR
jgi:hypothetical protein